MVIQKIIAKKQSIIGIPKCFEVSILSIFLSLELYDKFVYEQTAFVTDSALYKIEEMIESLMFSDFLEVLSIVVLCIDFLLLKKLLQTINDVGIRKD